MCGTRRSHYLHVPAPAKNERMHHTPPDFTARVYTPQRIAAVVDTLLEEGIAPARALQGSGLDESALHASETRVSYGQLATVCRNALNLSTRPALAVRAGLRIHVTAYGMYGYALLSSRVCADILEFSSRYRRVIGPFADLIYDRQAAPGVCRFEPLLASDPADPLYRFALEFTYAAQLTVTRDLYGSGLGYHAVLVTYPAPADAAQCGALLGCAMRFGQDSNELHFDPALAERAPQLQDPITHEMAREICQRFLTELPYCGGTAAAVRRALLEQMPWRFPHLESMAQELSIEPRTLRRRLEAQGTTYREILADVRRTLAVDYLRKTRMTTEDIASRLGYSDAANFRHAFLRWTGKTPNEYRRA